MLSDRWLCDRIGTMTIGEAQQHGARSVGVLGGTFDPIHNAHLLLAEQAREQFGLSRVLLLPSAHPPHKLNDGVTQAEHRYEMVVQAIADHPHFDVSRIELDRAGPSFTITTIRELKQAGLGEVYFITGADSILEMATWREPDSILAEAHVVAAPRPGFDIARAREALGPERLAKVRMFDCPLMDISSTEIRRRVATGRSIRYMAPDCVAEYVRRCHLYQGLNAVTRQARSGHC